MKAIQGIKIRRAMATDAENIWEVRKQAILFGCRKHYPTDLLESWGKSPMPVTFASFVQNEPFYVAETESRMVGFAGLKRSASEVNAVFVLPEVAGHGVGMRLLQHLETFAQENKISILTLSASLNSVPFYKACGYKEGSKGLHTTTSGLQIECVSMEKELGHPARA